MAAPNAIERERKRRGNLGGESVSTSGSMLFTYLTPRDWLQIEGVSFGAAGEVCRDRRLHLLKLRQIRVGQMFSFCVPGERFVWLARLSESSETCNS